MKIIPVALLILLLAPLPAAAQETLQQRVEARLKAVGPGTRFGLVVATDDGREIIAIAPDDRFIPASNTKMVTTAAAFANLPALDQPDATGGAAVRLDGGHHPDVILEGHGDARLSSAPTCMEDCLAALADAVAARTRVVGNVVGDDTLFPDQRWSPGMSWNNIPTRSGTATSALTLDDNELEIFVAPGEAGGIPVITAPFPYYTLQNRALTVATGKTALDFDRAPGSMILRITGTILQDAAPQKLRPAIDDPAHYAAWRLKALLEARGVQVRGRVDVRHRPLAPSDDPLLRGEAPPARPPAQPVLARLVPPPLAADLTLTNKVSHNLHAELLLRRVALVAGTGAIADGQVAVRAMLASAGVPRTAYDFSDGSGMSTYNRVAPRGMVIFLRWIAAQPWSSAWRATLPIAGQDGTLATRFRGTGLERRLFAKTGTLNATNALSGYLTAKSGRTLIFAAYANDVPEGVSATPAMDAALEMIAAEN